MTFLLYLIAHIVRAFPLPAATDGIRRILVVDLNYLGDMLFSSPVYRALKQHIPGARVDALVFDVGVPALRANPFVDTVIATPSRSFLRHVAIALALRAKKYDLVLQLNTSLKTNVLLLCASGRYRLGYDYAYRGCLDNLRVPIKTRTAKVGRRTDECVNLLEQAFGWSIRDRSMIFVAEKQAEVRAGEKLADAGVKEGDALIGIHAHTRLTKHHRQWELSRFALLANTLIERHSVTIVLTGSQDDLVATEALASRIHPRERIVVLAGRLTLQEFAAAMKRFRLFITVNTGPMHIAIAQRVPTVAIIGGTPASVVFPQGDPIFQYVMDPALLSWDPTILYPDYESAINSISVEDVLEKVELVLSRER